MEGYLLYFDSSFLGRDNSRFLADCHLLFGLEQQNTLSLLTDQLSEVEGQLFCLFKQQNKRANTATLRYGLLHLLYSL
ncbi:MAG: hypothetical protein AAFN92_12065, partial [Bacteroidota bacterium]